jgi:hypothetical protein
MRTVASKTALIACESASPMNGANRWKLKKFLFVVVAVPPQTIAPGRQVIAT